MIADMLRGAANFWDAVQAARAEQRTGFSEREAGDYLDTAGLDDAVVPGFDWESETNRLALKLHSIRGLANGWRATNLDGISSGDLVLHVAAGTLLEILNEGINFWTPPEPEADDVVDAEVHCEGCNCPTICGCGRALYSEPESPDGPLFWFHHDDGSPITLDCARIRDGLTATGDSTATLLVAAADWISDECDKQAGGDGFYPPLVCKLRNRAIELNHQQSVREFDLAAYITASLSQPGGMRPTEAEPYADSVASSLLDDFHITPKK